MCNKVFSLNFDMDNPNPSFLGNVQWKLVKEYKNSDFQIIFYIPTVTINLLEILDILPEICLTCAIKCFPSSLICAIQIHHYFQAMFNGSLSNNIKTVISRIFSILQLSLSTCLKFLEALPGICLTCAIKCFPSILIWAIQFHHYFQAMFNGSLSNNIKSRVFSILQLSLSMTQFEQCCGKL